MKKYMTVLLALTVALWVFSCSDHTSGDAKENLSNEEMYIQGVTIDKMVAISQDLGEIFNREGPNEESMSRSSAQGLGYAIESEVTAVLKPMIDNGRVIQTDVVSMIERNSWWGEFTTEEREAIYSFDAAELAALSLIFSNVNIEGQNTRASIGGCLGYALIGIGGADGFITGTAGLMTAKTAIKIIKNLARRTLGIIGVAWAVYDFAECMTKD